MTSPPAPIPNSCARRWTRRRGGAADGTKTHSFLGRRSTPPRRVTFLSGFCGGGVSSRTASYLRISEKFLISGGSHANLFSFFFFSIYIVKTLSLSLSLSTDVFTRRRSPRGHTVNESRRMRVGRARIVFGIFGGVRLRPAAAPSRTTATRRLRCR